MPDLESATLAKSLRARLGLLTVVAAALLTMAHDFDGDHGIFRLGETTSGALGTHAMPFPHDAGGGTYKSTDGGLTWRRTSQGLLPLEPNYLQPSSAYAFKIEGPLVVREEYSTGGEHVVFSSDYFEKGGNRWMQALDKRDIKWAIEATRPQNIYYDDPSGNLIVAMGIQGVVVVAPDGTSTHVAVGPYSPTDFSFRGKAHAYASSMLHPETAKFTGFALLLAFSFAALALVSPAASWVAKTCFVGSAAISAFLAIVVGTYPQAFPFQWGFDLSGLGVPIEHPASDALSLTGNGLLPAVLVVAGLFLAHAGAMQILRILAATIGMLLLVGFGAIVLFETGPKAANLVALGLVSLASLVLLAHQIRSQHQVQPAPTEGAI